MSLTIIFVTKTLLVLLHRVSSFNNNQAFMLNKAKKRIDLPVGVVKQEEE